MKLQQVLPKVDHGYGFVTMRKYTTKLVGYLTAIRNHSIIYRPDLPFHRGFMRFSGMGSTLEYFESLSINRCNKYGMRAKISVVKS